MVLQQRLRFGPFELDPRAGLKRGNRLVHLTPKALAVIAELTSRPGEVVTKDELFEAVWAGTAVSDAALVTCIQEIRQALRDNATRPRFIETVHRRGYRFLQQLEKPVERINDSRPTSDGSRLLVGRAQELEELDAVLARAQRNQRQIIFVSGDAGIGKTSLVEAFLEAHADQDLQFACGQSVERHETSEAYQPLLEALTRWGRQSDGKRLLPVLERHAPTWMAQLPSLLAPERLRQFERRAAGSTRDRMLRELTDALEAAAMSRPLILLLEDLHWADVSTLDWLATFARRREPAAVLVVATDRPFEAIRPGHPLRAIKQDLLAQGCAGELALRDLTREDTFEYLRVRFPPAPGMDKAIAGLASHIHRHTEGRPLLLVSVADELVTQGQLAGTQSGWVVEQPAAGTQQLPVPKDVDHIVEGRIEKLNGTARSLLEAASVGGIRVSAAALATAVDMPVIECEELCASIAANTQLIIEEGADEWPDGTVASQFAFAHSLYRDAIYRRIPAARRQALHHRIGLRLEQGYGGRVSEVASDLAMHFERGRDFPRAVQYLYMTGETAMRRSATLQALSDFEKALWFLERLAPSRERDETEAKLRIASGSMQMAVSGWGAPEVMGSFIRARALCEQLGFPPHMFATLWGTWVSTLGQGSIDRAREAAEELIGLASKTGDSSLVLQAEHATWTTHFAIGDLERTHRHTQTGLSLYRVGEHAGLTPSYGNHDAGVCCRMIGGRVLAALARAGEAREMGEDALRLAAELQHPFTRALALYFVSAIYQVLGEPNNAALRADEAIALSRDHGFRLVELWATVISGSATATGRDAKTATVRMRQAIEAARSSGSDVFSPYHLGLLAHAQLAADDLETGLATVREGLTCARRTGERFYEAELLRLQAALLLERGAMGEASGEGEALFRESLAVARRQKASLFTLRTSLSFARLRIAQGRPVEAAWLLRGACTEVGDQPGLVDLKEARELLAKCDP